MLVECTGHGNNMCYANPDGTHVPYHACCCVAPDQRKFSENCGVKLHAEQAQRAEASRIRRPEQA